MMSGRITYITSSGTWYLSCTGSVSSPARRRYTTTHHRIRPQVITPTESAAIQDPVHRLVIRSVWFVTPGPPGSHPRCTSAEHPVVTIATTATRTARRTPVRHRRLVGCDSKEGLSDHQQERLGAGRATRTRDLGPGPDQPTLPREWQPRPSTVVFGGVARRDCHGFVRLSRSVSQPGALPCACELRRAGLLGRRGKRAAAPRRAAGPRRHVQRGLGRPGPAAPGESPSPTDP